MPPLILAAFVSAITPLASTQITNVLTGIAKDQFAVETPDYWRIANLKKRHWDMPCYEMKIQGELALRRIFMPQDQVTINHLESVVTQLREKNSVIEQDAKDISKNARNAFFKSWRNSALALAPLAALAFIPGVAAIPFLGATLIGATVAVPAAIGLVTALKEHLGRNLLYRFLYGLKMAADNALTDPTNNPAYAFFNEYWGKINPNVSLIQFLQENSIEEALNRFGDITPLMRGKLAALKDSTALLDRSKNVGGIPGFFQDKLVKLLQVA